MSIRVSLPHVAPRASLRLATLTVAAVLSACGPNVMVRTAASPEAGMLAGRHTFSVVEASTTNDPNDTSATNYGIEDPMVNNSITSQQVAAEIRAAFEAKGYRYTNENPDFVLTYKATVAPILDVRTYDFGGYGYYGYNGYYGYHGYYDNAGYCCGNDGYGYATAQYDRGTVIIDAVEPGSGKLMWRGQGTSGLYSEPKKFSKQLRHAVHAVAKKFPNALAPAVVAVSP